MYVAVGHVFGRHVEEMIGGLQTRPVLTPKDDPHTNEHALRYRKVCGTLRSEACCRAMRMCRALHRPTKWGTVQKAHLLTLALNSLGRCPEVDAALGRKAR